MSIQESAAFPMSPHQRRLRRFGEKAERGRSWCVIDIRGAVAAETLEAVLERTAARHEALRTHYPSGSGAAVQVVSKAFAPILRTLEGRRMEPAELRRRIAALAEVGEIDAGPVLRAGWIVTSDETGLLVLSLPSLSADPRTFENLYAEVARDLGAAVPAEDAAAPAEDEALRYVDFAAWQNELVEEGDAGEASEHWRRRLSRPMAALRFPGDRPEPAPGAGRIRAIPIAGGSAAWIRDRAEGWQVSEAAVLLAAWQALAWRLTGERNFALGAVVDGRPFPELAGAAGLFARAVPVVAELDDELGLRRLARRAHAALAETETWCDGLPWDFGVPGSASAGYLAVGFEHRRTPEPRAAAGARFAFRGAATGFEPFKLKLVCRRGEELDLELHYDAGCFTESRARRFGKAFEALLQDAGRKPMSVGELGLLPACERHQLFVEVNDSRRDLEARTIPELIEEAEGRVPDRVAVEVEGRCLTYGELGRRSRRLARRLEREGVGTEDRVGLCLERCLEMIVSLVGVMRCGAAYVPLDPSYPPRVLASLLADSGASLVLTRGSVLETDGAISAKVLDLDRDRALIDAESDAERPTSVTGGQLAYVIYTSGSTGRPKGVGVEHRHLANYVHGVLEHFGLPPGSTWATVSTLAADLGNTQVFGSLASAGRLHVVPYDRGLDPRGMAEYFAGCRIDAMKITPSHLQALQRPGELAAVLPQRRLMVAGEAVDRDWVEQMRRAAPRCRLHSSYGPTEATVSALCYRAPDGAELAPAPTMALGRPLANVRVYLADRHLRPVSGACPGEIVIGGSAVSRGYLGQPALTAGRFLPDPYSTEPGARLYRTGDLGRYMDDFALEFLTRVDHQVKIRGHRVELGQIEATLRRRVREAVVLHEREASRLAAWVVPGPEGPADAEEVRAWLAARLPAHMVPEAWAVLDALPLNKNGKVDRRALPPAGAPSARPSRVAPRDEIESRLAEIWEDLLGVEGPGVTDDFFQLGGHSLLAVKLVGRIREEFHRELPVRALFHGATIAHLAGRIRCEAFVPPKRGGLAPIGGSGPQPPLYLVHPVGGNTLCYTELVRYLGSARPVYAFEAAGLGGEIEPVDNLPRMAEAYLGELAKQWDGGPFVLGGWSMGGVVAFEMARQWRAKGHPPAQVILLDAYPLGRSARFRAEPPARNVAEFAWHFLGPAGTAAALARSSISRRAFTRLSEDEQLELVLQAARHDGLLPADAGRDRMRPFYDVFRANRRALRTYRPEPYDGDVVWLRACRRKLLRGIARPPGWDGLTSLPVDVVDVDGDHFSILREPLVRTVAEAIENRLEILHRKLPEAA